MILKTKKLILLLLLMAISDFLYAQTTLAGDYKSVFIGDNGIGDHTRSLILLHQMSDGNPVANNYAIGSIQARRGNQAAFNRLDVVQLNTQSAYNQNFGLINSLNDVNIGSLWRLKTCFYNGVKYLAVDVPFSAAYHNEGYTFVGWGKSTGEFMKSVSYWHQGSAINTQILTNIQDFVPNMNETHFANNINLMANVGIGTTTPQEKLSVNGKIRAHEIKVEATNWPDYVFEEGYEVVTLEALESYLKTHKHLPEMPSAKEVESNGMALGEMNKLLLKKIEELTLHLIEKDKALIAESEVNIENQKRISAVEKALIELKQLVNQIIRK